MNHPVVVVVSVGEMGAAVGGRLREKGAEVRTSLKGRSAGSAERAKRHGLIAIDDDAALVAGAEFVLSIAPPAEAVPLARRLAPAISAASKKPLYVDCNAVSPATVKEAASIIHATGAGFVDAGIIGGPPQPNTAGPKFYSSGGETKRFLRLRDYGLDVREIEGEIGVASALKMAYGSLTKGVTAIGIAMILSASKAGVADVLKREFADSQPQLMALMKQSVPRSVPKAYRWVAEMEEISAFIGNAEAGGTMFQGVARLYDLIARSHEGDGGEIGVLKRFLES